MAKFSFKEYYEKSRKIYTKEEYQKIYDMAVRIEVGDKHVFTESLIADYYKYLYHLADKYQLAYIDHNFAEGD